MSIKTKPFEFAGHIETAQDVKEYLVTFFEEDGTDGLITALGNIARKKGMTKVAEMAGVSRQSLYRTLGEKGNPNFSTVNKVIEALGLKITFQTQTEQPNKAA